MAAIPPPSLAQSSPPSPSTSTPCTDSSCSYLLIQNPSKSTNLGPILRCASAFAVEAVILIGYDKCSVKGSHGASKYVQIKSFYHIDDAVCYLRNECNVVSIIGILGDVNADADADADADARDNNANNVATSDADGISGRKRGGGGTPVEEDEELNVVKVVPTTSATSTSTATTSLQQKDPRAASTAASSPSKIYSYPASYPIHTRPFPQTGNICFSINRKSIGLSVLQAKYCDFFVHIQTTLPSLSPSPVQEVKVPSTSKSPSLPYTYGLLDSQTCLSITLHHYNAFAKHSYVERNIDTVKTQKFELEKTFTQRGRMQFDENADDVRRRRMERRVQYEREVQAQAQALASEETDEERRMNEGENELLYSLFS